MSTAAAQLWCAVAAPATADGGARLTVLEVSLRQPGPAAAALAAVGELAAALPGDGRLHARGWAVAAAAALQFALLLGELDRQVTWGARALWPPRGLAG